MQAIRRVDLTGAGDGRQVQDLVIKRDRSEAVARVEDADVRPEDELITNAQYAAYVDAIQAYNQANQPPAAADPIETEYAALVQLLGPDWAASETAWATLTATQKAEHNRVRSNALR